MATHKKQVNSLNNVRFFPDKSNSNNVVKARSPVIQPTHRLQQQRMATMNVNQQNQEAPLKKPQLSRCGSMGMQTQLPCSDSLTKLQEIEKDIQTTEVETISIDKLQKWRIALIEQCESMEDQLGKKEVNVHQYAFKVVPHTQMIEKRIIEEIQNREKLEAQTSQMIKYQDQEINQLLQKIQALQESLKK
ncbi:unnamed protein product [Paramecium pentaurelia]|uniref:Uncharacterized protein n=1 Tax=Paramecium pentaurelia TaxID=43138 RepID=A0A8S1YMH9_9CILI|nr:unnamed protein product [Paramecium pentaurelia]